MTLYFSISELIIDPDAGLPIDVADKLLKYHIWQLNPIRLQLGTPVWASENSGYRHKGYERQHNRAPDDPRNNRQSWSRHTFDRLPTKDPQGKGAVDWTTKPAYLPQLGFRLLRDTLYSRICWYPNGRFYHCDYGYEERGKTLFVSRDGWKQEAQQSWLDSIGYESR